MSAQSFESLRAVPQGAAVAGMNQQPASTGNNSRFNAVKHGLTAKTPVLPGEDPAALQAKIDAYRTGQQTRTEARRERERLRALARRGIMLDERFVLDERGTVRDAQGYDGDLEAGLARWKAERGPQPCEKAYYGAHGAGGGNYAYGSVMSDVGAKPGHLQSQSHAAANADRACEAATGNGDGQGAPATCRADAVADDCAVNQVAAAGAERRDEVADLGQGGLSDSVPLTLAGQEPATNIQNEICGSGMAEDGAQEGAIDRVGRGDALGACEAGRADLGDGGGQAKTLGRVDDPSGARAPRLNGERFRSLNRYGTRTRDESTKRKRPVGNG